MNNAVNKTSNTMEQAINKTIDNWTRTLVLEAGFSGKQEYSAIVNDPNFPLYFAAATVPQSTLLN